MRRLEVLYVCWIGCGLVRVAQVGQASVAGWCGELARYGLSNDDDRYCHLMPPSAFMEPKPATVLSPGDAGRQHKPIRCCIMATTDVTLMNLCRGRLEYFTQHGFDVSVVCAPTPHAAAIESRGVRLFTAPLVRAVTPLRDLQAVWALTRLFRRERFDLVEVSTPKAALVGSVAARLAGVRCLVHLHRGPAYDEQQGLYKWLMKASQWIPCHLADEVISISVSGAKQMVEDGICPTGKIRLLGQGSSNGVDLARFAHSPRGRERMRQELNLPPHAVVGGFVGRMTNYKGVRELIEAYLGAVKQCPNLHLLMVGEFEEKESPPAAVIETVRTHPQIRHVGWQSNTVAYYQAMDMMLLPSYREGLATVLLEAGAMGLPIIATDIPGCRDAVLPDQTAMIVPVGDVAALTRAIRQLADDAAFRQRLGDAGRRHVESSFAQEVVWQRQAEAFRSLVECKTQARRHG